MVEFEVGFGGGILYLLWGCCVEDYLYFGGVLGDLGGCDCEWCDVVGCSELIDYFVEFGVGWVIEEDFV